MNDFAYLPKNSVYLDSACQSLRPEPVVAALNSYYTTHNSCGERVKYDWGQKTDQLVESTRLKVLKYLKLSPRKFFVSFTLNTTYGLNLLLSQFSPAAARITSVTTSDIEHNSPFLSTISFAKKHGFSRHVISRNQDGSLPLAELPKNTLLVVNCASNIDGRLLTNIKDVIKSVHKTGGYVIIDAAQAMAHTPEILYKTDADAICFSAHKMYAPSLGGIIMKKDFAKFFDTTFIGGGMVDDVSKDTYLLSSDNKDHLHTKFEPGLQAWGEIVALGAAIDWLENLPKSAHQDLQSHCEKLFTFLKSNPKFHVVNAQAGPTISFYLDKKETGFDSHVLGAALADQGIMARTGYFCVHYYLDHKMHYPPLIRFSIGYHTTSADINKVIAALAKI